MTRLPAVLIVEAGTVKIWSGAIRPRSGKPVVGAYGTEVVEGRVSLEENWLTET